MCQSQSNRRPITIKLYQKHHCGGGLPALDLNAGRIRTLVSMVTIASTPVSCSTFLIGSSSFLQVTIKSYEPPHGKPNNGFRPGPTKVRSVQ